MKSGDPFEVPDDARELEPDARAVRRELRAAQRAVAVPARDRPAARLVLMLLLVGAAVALLLRFTGDRGASTPLVTALPLARPAASPGVQGGLLPTDTVQVRSGAKLLTEFRPGVFFVAPAGCECTSQVRRVASQADKRRVITYIVGAPSDADHLRALGASAGGDNIVVQDAGGRLVETFGRRALPVVLLVRRDGVVDQVLIGVSDSLDLDGPIARMLAATDSSR